jgi:hypothetical protein
MNCDIATGWCITLPVLRRGGGLSSRGVHDPQVIGIKMTLPHRRPPLVDLLIMAATGKQVACWWN